MRPYSLAILGAALTAAALFSQNALAFGSCIVYKDSGLSGPSIEIKPNTEIHDFGNFNFYGWRESCPTHPDPESGHVCKKEWAYMGRALDEISSARVPKDCILYLYLDPFKKGPVGKYYYGDHPKAYTGIPNDSASSAACVCGSTRDSAPME